MRYAGIVQRYPQSSLTILADDNEYIMNKADAELMYAVNRFSKWLVAVQS